MGSPSIAGAEGASHGQAQGRRLALSLKSGYVSPCQMNTVVELLASYGRGRVRRSHWIKLGQQPYIYSISK